MNDYSTVNVIQRSRGDLNSRSARAWQTHGPWEGLQGSPRQRSRATPKPGAPWRRERTPQASRGAAATSPRSFPPWLRLAEVLADILEL